MRVSTSSAKHAWRCLGIVVHHVEIPVRLWYMNMWMHETLGVRKLTHKDMLAGCESQSINHLHLNTLSFVHFLKSLIPFLHKYIAHHQRLDTCKAFQLLANTPHTTSHTRFFQPSESKFLLGADAWLEYVFRRISLQCAVQVSVYPCIFLCNKRMHGASATIFQTFGVNLYNFLQLPQAQANKPCTRSRKKILADLCWMRAYLHSYLLKAIILRPWILQDI